MTDTPLPNNPPPKPLQVSRQQVEYSGPIPPPAMLEHYNKVVPGAAERILKMAEEQSAHRQSLEKQALATDSRNSTLGIVCALIITIGVFALSAFAIYLRQPLTASVIGALGIGSLVGTFVYGTRSRRLERESRLK